MPNWCEQELTIKGDYGSLEKFIEFAKSKKYCLDAEKFIPMPKSLREATSGSEDIVYDIWYGDIDVVKGYGWIPNGIKTDRERLKDFFRKRHKDADKKAEMYKENLEKYGHKTWYDWAIMNWGSKWGICNPTLVERPRSLVYRFESAWSPVIPLVLKMSEMYPQLTFRLQYYEMGAGFQGDFVCKAGKIEKDDTFEYHGHRGG